MPEISRFYGIVIKMFHNDHQPPHFHAEHGGDQMIVAVETLGVIAGQLRPRAMGLEWNGRRSTNTNSDSFGSRPETRSPWITSIRCLDLRHLAGTKPSVEREPRSGLGKWKC